MGPFPFPLDGRPSIPSEEPLCRLIEDARDEARVEGLRLALPVIVTALGLNGEGPCCLGSVVLTPRDVAGADPG